jgi:DNA-directed RNA polymerase specialized sigma24 family protein
MPKQDPEKYGKRLKVLSGLDWVPRAYSFTFFEIQRQEASGGEEWGSPYTVSDGGEAEEGMYDKFEEEELILQVLYNLDEREKLIFCYQLLRDNGYQIKHSAFAKTIGINRQRYMVWLKRVRDKTKAIIQKETKVQDK